MSIEWLAGLLEGEGCFYVQSGHHTPRVQLTMTDWLEHTMIQCGDCGAEFHADDARNRYCSDECRPGRLAAQNAWARKNRTKAASHG